MRGEPGNARPAPGARPVGGVEKPAPEASRAPEGTLGPVFPPSTVPVLPRIAGTKIGAEQPPARVRAGPPGPPDHLEAARVARQAARDLDLLPPRPARQGPIACGPPGGSRSGPAAAATWAARPTADAEPRGEDAGSPATALGVPEPLEWGVMPPPADQRCGAVPRGCASSPRFLSRHEAAAHSRVPGSFGSAWWSSGSLRVSPLTRMEVLR